MLSRMQVHVHDVDDVCDVDEVDVGFVKDVGDM